MSDPLPQRLSPVHDLVEHLHPQWGVISGMPAALDFGKLHAERAIAAKLGLCDASAFLRLVVKGPGAVMVLQQQGVDVPGANYRVAMQTGGGQCIRTGAEEYFVEDGIGTGKEGRLVSALEKAVRARKPGGPYEVARQDACFLVSGTRAVEALSQTCGVDLRKVDGNLIMSRVAGVSVALRMRNDLAIPAFQIWMDPSFGPYLWETLLEIVGELDGGPVGLRCFWPELN